MVQRPPDQPVRTEFPAQRPQRSPRPITEQGVGDSLRSAKPRNNAPHGRNFNLSGGIPYKEDFCLAEPLPHGDPTSIYRDAGPLPLQRREIFLFQKQLDAAFRFFAAALSDDPKRPPVMAFRDQPVEVGRIIRRKPDACGVRRIISWQSDQSLHQRNRFYRRPTCGSRHAACRAVGANHMLSVELITKPGLLDLQPDTAAIRSHSHEPGGERKGGAGALRLTGKRRNQPGSFDNQIRISERYLRRTAVSEQFKAANLVADAAVSLPVHLMPEMMGNDKRTRRRVETRPSLNNMNFAARLREPACGVQPGGGSADYNHFTAIPLVRGAMKVFFHSE